MPGNEHASLTKELPLSKVDQTLAAITPGMPYSNLLRFAADNTDSAIPGLIRKRFLLVAPDNHVRYDEFLALVNREGINSPIVRKAMLFTWAYRDDRIRRFIIERIANANGKWSAAKLLDKSNADFFDAGGAKARSNFEYFLVETGIFDPKSRQVGLDLGDNWLEDAARIAVQHESDPETRRALLENPYKFLADRGLNALANATVAELVSRKPAAAFPVEPTEDDLITADPKRKSKSKPWDRKKPKSADKASTEALIDLVARERANQSHFRIEKALDEKIRRLGYEPRSNANIDMYYEGATGTVLIEVKSCTDNNIHAQIRKGVSQLLEYRYLYSDELASPVHLTLALEAAPGAAKQWLIDYLDGIDISVVWLDSKSGHFLMNCPVPKALVGLCDESLSVAKGMK